MRRRSHLRRAALLAGATAAFSGCNAILGIESGVFEPDGGVASLDGATDATVTPDVLAEAAADALVDAPVEAGECKDLDSNPKHCGACNHDCLGGTCIGARCQPTTLASDAFGPVSIALDATHVYWANPSTQRIHRVPKAGGASQQLYSAPAGTLSRGLAVHAGQIVFAVVGEDNTGIYRCPVAGCGGAPTMITPSAATAFDVNGAGVLSFSDIANGTVSRCTLPCASIETVAAGEVRPDWVAALGTSVVYWTVILPGQLRASVDGGAAMVLQQADFLGQILPGADRLLYAQPSSGPRVALPDGGSPRRLYTGPSINNDHIAARGNVVVFNDYGSVNAKGGVHSCPLSGCIDGGTVAAQQEQPNGVAIDDVAIYWANKGSGVSGSIMRLAR